MNLRDAKMFDERHPERRLRQRHGPGGHAHAKRASLPPSCPATIADNLESDRTAVSGVNLDEEAAQLIQYQQAYQASAKMLQIAQSVFDTLIQNLGR